MLEILISTGEDLDSKASEAMVGKFFDCVEFEEWAAKAVTYLEQEYSRTAVIERVLSSYKNLNQNNNYTFYQQLLGVLKSFS